MTSYVFLRNAQPTRIPARFQNGLILDFFSEPDRSTLAADISELLSHIGRPSATGIDFLILGAAIYAADKKVPRRVAADRWTREFLLSLPVSDPSRWEAATPALVEALSFLTGDRWSFEWRGERNRLWHPARSNPGSFDAVCLFSGGLDSLAGAIDLLESPGAPRVALVGHYDSTFTRPIQEQLASVLRRNYGPDRVHLVQAFVRPSEGRHPAFPLPKGNEATTRSRSVVFAALGLSAATALGPDIPLNLPENGFIALNVPLISARLGSCSTRTTHPYFLNRLRSALEATGISNLIVNPFERFTKGEVLARSRNPTLLGQMAQRSVSCARPEQGRYEGLGYGNCGYCFPCLIRRASMHAVGLDDGSQYRHDICREAQLLHGRTIRGRDARAVFTALQQRDESSLSPLLSGPLPDAETVRDFRRVHDVGLAELRNLFQAKATVEVRQIAGL